MNKLLKVAKCAGDNGPAVEEFMALHDVFTCGELGLEWILNEESEWIAAGADDVCFVCMCTLHGVVVGYVLLPHPLHTVLAGSVGDDGTPIRSSSSSAHCSWQAFANNPAGTASGRTLRRQL